MEHDLRLTCSLSRTCFYIDFIVIFMSLHSSRTKISILYICAVLSKCSDIQTRLHSCIFCKQSFTVGNLNLLFHISQFYAHTDNLFIIIHSCTNRCLYRLHFPGKRKPGRHQNRRGHCINVLFPKNDFGSLFLTHRLCQTLCQFF